MNWKKISEKDKNGEFSVKMFGYLAERGDGVKIDKNQNGITVILDNGEEWETTWGELFADFEARLETNDS